MLLQGLHVRGQVRCKSSHDVLHVVRTTELLRAGCPPTACSAGAGTVGRFCWDSQTGRFGPMLSFVQLLYILEDQQEPFSSDSLRKPVPWDMITGPGGNIFVAVDPAHYVSHSPSTKRRSFHACMCTQ